jgi:hypothetical protein
VPLADGSIRMSGRTIQVYRSASAWSEATVTWNNQPSTTGTACTGPSVNSGNFDADVLTRVPGSTGGQRSARDAFGPEPPGE